MSSAEASSEPKNPKFNPDDCFNPVCGTKMDMFNSAIGQIGKKKNEEEKQEIECPVDRDELGRSTWNLLHTTAAYYPEKATEGEQTQANNLIQGLAANYPCEHCAADFREAIQEHPPTLGSRTSFMLWLCKQHNFVNEKIGKPTFSCDLPSLDRRWKYGGPGCWIAEYEGYAHETLGHDIDDEDIIQPLPTDNSKN
uniref:Sulfhydryl oxidase n=1 Tax=Aureoumbra lagunensis TaxID=44058 RepID=A0A7S3K308_9STRA|mmetsp:Transcript_23265/g.30143  ORF Transcript_23265/g.30143 Transcript_23265/m.30143 type:complete len:196 (+) Transcript_23265:3-590(+)